MNPTINATIKGVEFIDGKFHPFVERHMPCRVPPAEMQANRIADHSRCTIAQRFVGPGFATIREAASAAERCQVIKSDGTVADLKAIGS